MDDFVTPETKVIPGKSNGSQIDPFRVINGRLISGRNRDHFTRIISFVWA